MSDETSRYITMLGEASRTPQHELLLECMEHYHISGLKDLKTEQARSFWEQVKGRRRR